jgi:hypothetical protein
MMEYWNNGIVDRQSLGSYIQSSELPAYWQTLYRSGAGQAGELTTPNFGFDNEVG